MEDKIIKAFINYAQRDRIKGLHIAYYAKDTLHQYNHGYLNENQEQLINNETLFEIGSITKPIIAVLYSILLNRNKVDIEKTISYYINNHPLHPFFNTITLKDILAHIAGLPGLPRTFIKKMSAEVQDPYSTLRTDDLYNFLKKPEEITKPGKYHYSNIGYGILGEVLKSITSSSIYEISSELLFNELKMNRTDVINNLSTDSNIAAGYNFSDKPNKHWHNTVLEGAGCFLSCGNDMSKFLIANINPATSEIDQAIQYTHIPITNKSGMAWHYKNSFLSKILGYNGYIWHNGMTGGFSSFICFNKKKKNGLLLLANKAIPLESYFYRFVSYF